MPLLAVNFDPALVRLLRETKYFLLLKISVPDAAAVLFQSADTFRQQIGALDLMVGLYNKVQRTILAVEKPLVQQKLDAVEAALKRGLEELNWRTGGIDTYIRESLEAVKDVDMILTTIKDNVRNTQVRCCVHCM
jgi:dynein heavy chain